ncbi:ABC transporter substrate-binding protein [Streptomyces sp. NBC_01320]|uniref:ABC transporter substrate-binding protein n=1 Tax=Streptomyces sp. NBC_01320 TaxID=2903824 RepID=UPI002E0F9200|nr:ABC transporter substrate-binding protein [Streptomyces sp. NBC_01320]
MPFTVTADDTSRTVTIAMSKPYGFLLNTIGLAPIVCAKGMKDPSILKNSSSGTGPFVLTNYQPGRSMTFIRRQGYAWGPNGAATSAPGTPAKMVLKFVTDETTAANLILADQLNAAVIKGPERQRLNGRGLDKVGSAGSGEWLWFNQLGNRPTQDLAVQKALLMAADLPQLIKVSTGGIGTAATGLINARPTACPGNPLAGQLPEHDLDAAGALLDQAGWVEGSDGIRRKGGATLHLDVHYVPSVSVYAQPTAELVAQEWKALGVQTKLTADTTTALSQTMFQTSNSDVYLEPFGGNLPTQMVPYVSGPTPPDGVNLAGINNAAYNSLVAKAEALLLVWRRTSRPGDPAPLLRPAGLDPAARYRDVRTDAVHFATVLREYGIRPELPRGDWASAAVHLVRMP